MYKYKTIWFIIIGLIASLIPITLISREVNKSGVNFDIHQIIKYGPLFFVIFNVFYLSITNVILKNTLLNNVSVGVIAGIIISSYGRFIQNIPTKVFKMKDPNMFHIYAMIFWGVYYGVMLSLGHNLLYC